MLQCPFCQNRSFLVTGSATIAVTFQLHIQCNIFGSYEHTIQSRSSASLPTSVENWESTITCLACQKVTTIEAAQEYEMGATAQEETHPATEEDILHAPAP